MFAQKSDLFSHKNETRELQKNTHRVLIFRERISTLNTLLIFDYIVKMIFY